MIYAMIYWDQSSLRGVPGSHFNRLSSSPYRCLYIFSYLPTIELHQKVSLLKKKKVFSLIPNIRKLHFNYHRYRGDFINNLLLLVYPNQECLLNIIRVNFFF